MIVLYILLALILLVALVLALPVKVSLKFEEDFFYRVKFSGFTVYPFKEKPQKPKKSKEQTPKPSKPEGKNLFEKLKEKRGFKGAVKELFDFFGSVLLPLKKFLKCLKFRNIKVDLSVAGADAARTAIDYGTVCSIVYPVLSLFDSLANVKYKSINVRSDFEGKKSGFDFALDIKASLIFILIFGYKIFKEYKNFCARNDLQ